MLPQKVRRIQNFAGDSFTPAIVLGESERVTQGGESLKDGMDRASLAIEALVKKYPGKAVVIVTHSDICAVLIGRAERTPLTECYRKHQVPSGSIREVSVSAQTWTLKKQGAVSTEAKSP